MNHPLKNPEFRKYLAASLFGSLGAYLMEIALMWWVLEATGRRDSVAWVALATALTGLTASLFGGVLADRGNKVRLAALGYSIGVLAPLVAGLLLWSGHLSFGLVLAIVAVDNLAFQFFAPAKNALAPLLIPKDQYQQAMALANGMGKGLQMLSMPLGGVLVATIGVMATLFVTAAVYLVAAFLMSLVRAPRGAVPPKAEETAADSVEPRGFRARWIAPMADAARTLLSIPLLAAAVFVAALMNFILAPIAPAMAPYAKSLGAGPEGYGLLLAGLTAGELLGYAVFGARKTPRALPYLFGGNLAMGLGLASLAVIGVVPLAVLALAFSGFAVVALNVHVNALALAVIPEAYLGRAVSVLGAISMGLGPLGLAAAGFALRAFSPALILGVAGLAAALTSVLWLTPVIARAVREAEEAIHGAAEPA